MKWLQHTFSVCLKVSGHVLYRIWPQRQTGSWHRKHGVIEKEDAESNPGNNVQGGVARIRIFV